MKNLFAYLSIIVCLFSCNRKLVEPTPVDPTPVSVIKDFFEKISDINYGENAKVTIQFKIFAPTYDTDITVDWGDGINEKKTYFVNAYSSPLSSFDFSHMYVTNGKYKVRFIATNKVMIDSVNTELIISNKTPVPVADFSYEILDNGKIKFKNLSSDSLASFSWNDNKTINRSLLKDPQFIYEWNNNYTVYMTMYDKFGQWATVHKDITITNVIPRELSKFKGIVLNENYDFVENQTDCGIGFREVDPSPSYVIYSFDKGLLDKRVMIEVIGNFRVPSGNNFDPAKRYEKFKKYLTVGKKEVGFGSDGSWNAGIIIQTKDGLSHKFFNDTPDASIEITDIREIDQPVLFDDFYPKAFWVTFKLKADFKEAGKIDGTLKMRYLIYKLR